MVRPGLLACLCAAAFAALGRAPHAATPVAYRLTVPEPEHHWLQVEMRLGDLEAGPLELHMSRSSPGRYALHEFAKNVYDVSVVDGGGQPLAVERPDASTWVVEPRGSTVTVRYKVFGDYVDGTYLAVDETHAHINMPAALMWARGLDDRPATLAVTPPDPSWQVVTQLFPADGPFAFSAPNLQYLMDSPIEIARLAVREFTVDGHAFRVAVHHDGGETEMAQLARDAERIVREEAAIFGELPAYETGRYTFLGDFTPEAHSDGMEHRNSAVMTAPLTLERGHDDVLQTVAHEFFHSWNVERIRPRSLEPFVFDRLNPSAELWLAEGFTQYYGYVALSRSGLVSWPDTVAALSGLVTNLTAPGPLRRSAAESSRFATLMDGASPIDRTNWPDTVVSYYFHGGALALALDLSIREQTAGRATLDDFMRALWVAHGRPGGARPGYVDRPYTLDDVEARLSDVIGNAAFARDFVSRYVRGLDIPDYAQLLAPAGLSVARRGHGEAWWGHLPLETRIGAVVVTGAPSMASPAYAGGLDLGTRLVSIDGRPVQDPSDVDRTLRRHRPGDTITVSFVTRGGVPRTGRVTLAEDPALVISPIEASGATLTDAQRSFRTRWLGPR